jgi:hypothetical protein
VRGQLAQSLSQRLYIVSGDVYPLELRIQLTTEPDADIVCARARNHFDPTLDFYEYEVETTAGGGISPEIQRYKDLFKQVNARMRYTM